MESFDITPEKCPESFGDVLYQLRVKDRITQQTLGELIGYSGNAISRWERGQKLPITIRIVEDLSIVLQLSTMEKNRLRRAFLCDTLKNVLEID